MTPQTEALRIKSAPFPALKTLEKFDFTFQRSIKKQVIEQLGRLDSPPARENVILLVCQRPSVSPQVRPSVLPTGGHVFSPLVAMSSPHDVGVRMDSTQRRP